MCRLFKWNFCFRIVETYTPKARYIMPQAVLDSLDQVYRSNPYPSRLEYTTISGDLNLDIERIRVLLKLYVSLITCATVN